MTEDRDLTAGDIQALSSREGAVSLFATIGWQTNARTQQTTAAMGITADTVQRAIKHIERIASHSDGAEPLEVYLVELTSVTVAATQGIARALRNRAGNYLLILTDDYERIDFVLLERGLPVGDSGPMVQRQVAIRPRVLTVNRRNPRQVDLRVLRRFTYTERDSDAQYEKLLSAYVVADWSEPLFNNRSLFSDYYLNQRLPERAEWRERPEAAYRQIRDLMAGVRERLAGSAAAQTRHTLLDPLLSALGFRAELAAVPADGTEPHYRLSLPAAPEAVRAVCLGYGWNRNLDGRDETRGGDSAEENPGARVVELLQTGEAPWAIVTNGKLWRLYSASAHSRATNYYEIDLEETLATGDVNLAFRYFWLMFRASAFVPRKVTLDGQERELSFLDELVAESESYAKELGDRLKERVFEEIFPHFAAGFIDYLRAQPPITGAQQGALLPVARQLGLKREPDEAFRQEVFQGTLTFLYRLLFLLYAESRNLLPVREVRGYWEKSLTRLKDEIAAKGGEIVDDRDAKLRRAYSADSTALYDRLLELFAFVDQGSREVNLPHYNGGLFLTRPAAADISPEAANARFLLAYKIPDRQLALGLDRLARDLDPKRQSLVTIDYKSLGVRQLGSIYEGLLEFRVRVAEEKMAIVKGKSTEEVIPYREAQKNKIKVLTKGRGKNAEERVYHPGDVYLENDRRERKATGSYYTPDHIVQYIVEHAVGPVLEERLAALRPRFREAQQAYRNAVQRAEAFRKQGMKPDDPAKVANSYQSLVDDLFNLKVLDPAMGSGHFLVEAVDFICDRILGQRDGFLQAFPWNPVTAFLEETRRSILQEMERQGVTIDTARLTDINLLKRHVLKRCIYGVDLNPMAVELAKVSLWLDCFTLGAPLSFLDHHLKCGNSLIGTTVAEVEAELAKQKKGHTGTLFGGPFQGMLSATATMERLRRLPDATIEQAEQSRDLFRKLEDDLAPYKRLLDVWVSGSFGNKRAHEYLTVVGDRFAEDFRSGGRGLSAEYREAVRLGDEIGRRKRFFHWDLEFPEAYVDVERGTWKPQEQRGFDAIVGNPPYDVLASEELGYDVSQYLNYFRVTAQYVPAIRGKSNLYKLFITRGKHLLCGTGTFSFIVPMAILGDDQAAGVRRMLMEETQFVSVEAFPQKDDPHNRVFEEAKLSTAIFVTNAASRDAKFCVRAHPGRTILADSPSLLLAPSEIMKFDPKNVTIPACTQRDWEIAVRLVSLPAAKRLGDYCKASQGEVNETTDGKKGFISDNPKDGPQILRGSTICLYTVREPSQGEAIYLRKEKFLQGKPDSIKARHHEQRRVAWQESSPQNNFRRIIAAPIPIGEFCNHKINYIPEADAAISLDFVLCILNSKLSDWFFRLGSTNAAVSHYQVHNLPAPTLVKRDLTLPLTSSFERGEWSAVSDQLCAGCVEPGIMPQLVAETLAELSRRIQAIEAKRVLNSRSERSHLAPESQPIQDVIDAVLFRCYGLSEEEGQYITQRLREML